jgi:hypothetical protein
MKLIFTFFTVLFFTVVAAAQGRFQSSQVSISTIGNMATRVMIDGNKYKVSGNELVIKNLRMGTHTVKVYQLKAGRRGNQNNGYGNNNDNYQLVYNGNITLRQQYSIDIMINRFGKAFVDEQVTTQGYYNDDDDDDWGNNNNWNNNNNNSPVYTAMDAQSFEQFKQTIKNEMSDDTKLKISKQYMTSNYFTAAQVKDLLSLFFFEANKLELAKFAYKYTIDKNNYFVVNNSFSFSSSKEELMNYIQKNP